MGIRHASADSPHVTMDAMREIVARVLSVPLSDVSANSQLSDLGADSFQLVDLACHIESHFRIQFPSSFSLSGRSLISALAEAVIVQSSRDRQSSSEVERTGQRLRWL